MNYKKNTKDWKIGALVIHDADAKKTHMLMHIFKIEETKFEKVYYTRYIYGGNFTDATKVWKNCKGYLHDPKQFNIEIPIQEVSYQMKITGKSAIRFYNEINNGKISEKQQKYLDECKKLLKHRVVENDKT